MKYTVLTIALAASLAGCSDFTAGGSEPIPVVDAPREWLVVLIAYDRNELGPSVNEDISEFASFRDEAHRIHRIVLRDSVSYGASALLVDEDGRHPLEGVLSAEETLFDGNDLAAALARLNDRFAARATILLITGHGRGRYGFGLRDDDPSRTVTDRDIERLYETIDAERQPRFVFFDGSYTTHLEFLYPFRNTSTTVIAHTGNLRANALDYETLAATIADDISDDPATAETLADLLDRAEVVPDNNDGGAVVLTPASIATAVDSIRPLAEAIHATNNDSQSQEELQATLLAASLAPDVPGDASVSLGTVLDADALTAELSTAHPGLLEDAPWHRIVLHLVLVDELGTPTGHDADYRPDLGTPAAPSFCLETPWAPDISHGKGFLWDLWYRRY